MIIENKFEYGDKLIPFKESLLFVDYVYNNHDLTEWEDRLLNNGENYAVYSVVNRIGHNTITPILEYQWALVSNADISFNQLSTKEISV